MKNLSHDAAIDALCKCAASVSVLSYQEAIEGYFKLRGLLIPPAPSLAAQDGLVEALEVARPYVQNVVDAEGKAFNKRDLAKIDAALSAIKGDKS